MIQELYTSPREEAHSTIANKNLTFLIFYDIIIVENEKEMGA